MKRKVVTILGTRPEIIKMSPLLPEFDRIFDHTLIHTGQHYSENMDRIFFHDLSLRDPDIYLNIGSIANPGAQTARIIEMCEQKLLEIRPEAVIVHGDTNTCLGGAIAAAKQKSMGLKLIHVEAGARSFNRSQAEEINRTVVDHLSDLLLASSDIDYENLMREGISPSKAVSKCNTVIDASLRAGELIDDTLLMEKFALDRERYVFCTFHRQETVDAKQLLAVLVGAIEMISERLPVVIPIHPRTKKRMEEFGLTFANKHIKVVEPLAYRETIGLLKNARFCMTDSGGLQEEAVVFSIPTLILRKETELLQYVKAGLHVLPNLTAEGLWQEALPLIDDGENYHQRRSIKINLPKGVISRLVGDIFRFVDSNGVADDTSYSQNS